LRVLSVLDVDPLHLHTDALPRTLRGKLCVC